MLHVVDELRRYRGRFQKNCRGTGSCGAKIRTRVLIAGCARARVTPAYYPTGRRNKPPWSLTLETIDPHPKPCEPALKPVHPKQIEQPQAQPMNERYCYKATCVGTPE